MCHVQFLLYRQYWRATPSSGKSILTHVSEKYATSARSKPDSKVPFGTQFGTPMRIPFSPERRPTMYLTPDGFIVDRPIGVASEAEVQRRKAALRIKILTEQQRADVCSICLDPHIERAAFISICGHYFHNSCMERWLIEKNTCPLCNETVAP